MPFALDGNPTSSEVSEAVNYLLSNFDVSIASDPNTGQITGPAGSVVGYLYKYIAIKYANSFDGTVDFSDSPTNKLYFGLRNSNSITESTNPIDYIWTKVTGGFGTTKFFWYSSTGGRQIQIAIATSAPDSGWIKDTGNPIDLDIITSATASNSFIATFSPPVLQVPYDTSADFTGLNPKLYGNNNNGYVDFVASQTDTDVSFINNTWRIGGSATTGYADIVKSNITIGDPTDAGYYASFPAPTAMPANNASISVPIRYKDYLGTIRQSTVAVSQFVFSYTGATGNKSAQATLYQWNTTTPTNPSGTSTFTWATGANSTYTGAGGWSTSIPTNPGVPLIKLWSATKGVTDTGTSVTTIVNWSSGYSVQDITQNGAAGLQSANPTVYQWAPTIPAGPSGYSYYTWSTASFTAPSGWTLTPGTSPTVGYTLWAAVVNLVDSSTVAYSFINWTLASISAVGYVATGATGASARICYTKTSLPSLASTPANISVYGTGAFPPNDSWGSGTVWGSTSPTIVAGESVYQSDGIYNPTTLITVWNVPYLSTLKVGSLSAITANMGLLTSGEIQVGSSPLISGSTMTGSGTHLYGDGRFTMGNTTTNINFNGSALTLNGNVVDASNVKNGSLSLVASFNITGLITYIGASGSTLTASTSNTIGTFAITNTSSTGGYLTVTGTGRTGVSGSAPNATQSFAIFDGAGNSYFQYGWTREIEDAKSFTFIFYMYGSTTATFYLNGAKSNSASTLVYVTQITAQGIRN